jgi:hypothetical protein
LLLLGPSTTRAEHRSELPPHDDGRHGLVGRRDLPTGYPFPDALNAHQSRNDYVPVGVNGTPTPSQISNYKSDLAVDIYDVGAPLVGDGWETPSRTYHLGHPHDHTIFHWFEIRGYQNTGGSTMYEDSASGSAYVSWSASVPPYSTLPSLNIAYIIGVRGYVW